MTHNDSIPIYNLYVMYAYAFGSISMHKIEKHKVEDFLGPLDLFAEMFIVTLNHQIKRGLLKNYIILEEETTTLKGKILLDESLKGQTVLNNRMICSFDEYNTNTYENQIIRKTIEVLLKYKKLNISTRKSLKKSIAYFSGVDLLPDTRIKWNIIRYQRNNSSYRFLLNISYLILEKMILVTKDGSYHFKDSLDSQLMSTLFEKFILKYMKYHHNHLNPKAANVTWDTETESDSFYWLPRMKTDITLTGREKTLIIDSKYYQEELQKHSVYNTEKMRSSHLYQIQSYVNNMSSYVSGVSGMVLYAKTNNNDEMNYHFNIGNHDYYFRSLDLNRPWSLVVEDLEDIVSLLK